MENCIFCKIGKGEIPAHKIYEDQEFFAFLDIKPHAKGHTVLIPKKHGLNALDYNDEDLSRLMCVIKKIMLILKKKLNPDGFNVGWNDGSAAGQVVPHLHLHILPRYNDDNGGSMHSIIKNPQVDVEDVAKLFK
ncbi:MAG: HIT family protein [Nanoarchaeota archaeon]|nr:HIT family protein [Nanoarchaeota archaeon]MBU1643981.1 HIT family protein [Nanoarchaeota archaeon]MBU1977076.1 HIT family protein [Nanoarchaeota archaeon]